MCRPSRTLQTGDAPALEQGIPEMTVHTTATAATATLVMWPTSCSKRAVLNSRTLAPVYRPGGAGKDGGDRPALVKLLVPVAVPPSRSTAWTPVPSY